MRPITPDLLSFDDGTAVLPETWRNRRQELFEAIIPHEYGGLPPDCESVESILLSDVKVYPDRVIEYKTYEVRCFVSGKEISFLLELWVPQGDGPFPVVLDGDGCWSYFNDQIISTVTRRGYIAASFNRTALAGDNQERFRQTGLYRLFPNAEFGALAAWAWGYHQCIDVLTDLDFVGADQIAITGHSRGGKTVLLAGATDERIAVTNPNCSGAGGSGLNRWKGEGAEVINDFNRSGNMFWFGKGFGEYAGRDKEIPYDQHFLHALTAPRGLLITEAYGDMWANPAGSYCSCRAAERAYEHLGASDMIGWSIREGEHSHSREDYSVLLDFLDEKFLGRKVIRSFKREHFPDLDQILT